MLSQIKEAINLHHVFLDLVHSRETSIESLHHKNMQIQGVHRKVDDLYQKVENLSFKFTNYHLLPYALFKYYSQNDIQVCNNLIKEYKQKVASQERITEKYAEGISNNTIEHDSVCLLLTLDQEQFCDIRYVT